MADFGIKCTVKEITGNRRCCIGSAQVQLGEEYIIGPRTPENGMCGRAFHAIHPMALAMRFTEKMSWEKDDYIDVTCPDACVTYRLTHIS